MDLSDRPPGTEDYEDELVKVKTKNAKDVYERNFAEYLQGLTLSLEDGTTGCVLEKRTSSEHDNPIYLCYPCSVPLYGVSTAKNHLYRKNHLAKLLSRKVWPNDIYKNHPFETTEPKTETSEVAAMPDKTVATLNSNDCQFDFSDDFVAVCLIQKTLNAHSSKDLIGLEYLVEILPGENDWLPTYQCILCSVTLLKNMVLEHFIKMSHKSKYLSLHFHNEFKTYAEEHIGTPLGKIVDMIVCAIVAKYGHLSPVQCSLQQWNVCKAAVCEAVNNRPHFSEQLGHTFLKNLKQLQTSHNNVAATGYHKRKDAAEQEKSKKPSQVVTGPWTPISCTYQAEFAEYLPGLTLSLEDGTTSRVVDRVICSKNGKVFYLCYPCSAALTDEICTKDHLSSKKHNYTVKILKNWPREIYDNHPLLLTRASIERSMALAAAELQHDWNAPYVIQPYLDKYKRGPLIGLGYLVEILRETVEPNFYCVLCSVDLGKSDLLRHFKQKGHKRLYLSLHFPTAISSNDTFSEKHMMVVCTIEKKYGRQKPQVQCTQYQWIKYNPAICEAVRNREHFSEKLGHTYTGDSEQTLPCVEETCVVPVQTDVVPAATHVVPASSVVADKTRVIPAQTSVVLDESRYVVSQASAVSDGIWAVSPGKTAGIVPAENSKELHSDFSADCSVQQLLHYHKSAAICDAVKKREHFSEKPDDTFDVSLNQSLHLVTDKIVLPVKTAVTLPSPNADEFQLDLFAPCYIQPVLDDCDNNLLIGIEYLVEIVPDDLSPKYYCALCPNAFKEDRVVEHLAEKTHMLRYLSLHFPTVSAAYHKLRLNPIHSKMVLDNIISAIERNYGRMLPVMCSQRQWHKHNAAIWQAVKKRVHFSEQPGRTFIEVLDLPLPPVQDVSGTEDQSAQVETAPSQPAAKKLGYLNQNEDETKQLLKNALKWLDYYKKNPEEHPQYTIEWQKFWYRRYTEVKAENHDPDTYDFKPEWRAFWGKRMVELHDEEISQKKKLIQEKLKSQLDNSKQIMSEKKRSPLGKRIAPSPRRSSSLVGRRTSSPARNSRSPAQRSRSPARRSRSPAQRSRSPARRSRSPVRRSRSPARRSRSPARNSCSPAQRSRSPARRSRSPARNSCSPARRSRSPARNSCSPAQRSRSPARRSRSPARRSRSPARRSRLPAWRSRSPARRYRSPARRSRSPAQRSRSPARRSRSPARRARSSAWRSRSTARRSLSPARRSPSPARKSCSPARRSRSPARRSRSPAGRSLSPARRSPSPARKSCSPARRSRSPARRSRSPARRSRSPAGRSRSPARESCSSARKSCSSARRSRSPARKSCSPARRSRSPARRSRSPAGRSRSPARKSCSSARKSCSSARRSPSPARKSCSPARRSRSPAGRSRSPARKSCSSARKSCSSARRSRSPARGSRSPAKRSRFPAGGSRSPARRSHSPARRSRSSARRSLSPAWRSPSPARKSCSAARKSRSRASGPRSPDWKPRSPARRKRSQDRHNREGLSSGCRLRARSRSGDNIRLKRHSRSRDDIQHGRSRDELRTSNAKSEEKSSRKQEEFPETRSKSAIKTERDPSPVPMNDLDSKSDLRLKQKTRSPSLTEVVSPSQTSNFECKEEVEEQEECTEETEDGITQDEVDNNHITLAEYLKHPEKHPQYNEQWQKFWTRRCEEDQEQNKDPTEYDFKPDWTVFWAMRMVELHEEEIKKKNIIQKKLDLLLEGPPERKLSATPTPNEDISPLRKPITRSQSPRRRPPTSDRRSRSPAWRRRSPAPGHSSQDRRKRRTRSRSREILRPSSGRERRYSRSREDVRRDRSREKRDTHSQPARSNEHSHTAPSGERYKHREATYDTLKSGDSTWSPNSVTRFGDSTSSLQEQMLQVLRRLVALDDHLGPSLGPQMLDLLSEALKMEKVKPNSSQYILDVDHNAMLLEMANEKLKGKVEVGLLGSATAAVRVVVSETSELLQLVQLRKQERRKELVARQSVTTEEMATLVHVVLPTRRVQPNHLGTQGDGAERKTEMSALQIAYDAQNKTERRRARVESPSPSTDAMDGLSDSELKTLIQNFKQLSPDEQDRLVCYVQKLKVRDPIRVENLRLLVDVASIEKRADEASVSSPLHQPRIRTSFGNEQDYFNTLKKGIKSSGRVVGKFSQQSGNVLPHANSEQVDVGRLIEMVQNIARRNLPNVPPAPDPLNTDTQAEVDEGVGMNIESDPTRLRQGQQNNDASGIPDSAAWTQNLQTGSLAGQGQSRTYGVMQHSHLQANDSHQFGNEYTDCYRRQQLGTHYRQPGNSSQQNYYYYPHEGNSSQQDRYLQSGNPQDSQQSRMFQKDLFLQNEKWSQEEKFLQKKNLSQQNEMSTKGTPPQKDREKKQTNFWQLYPNTS